jgi:hypothetical protein
VRQKPVPADPFKASDATLKVAYNSKRRLEGFGNEEMESRTPKRQLAAKPYAGVMIINSSTGLITGPQNVYIGYKEAVCVQCHNGIAGGVITRDDWVVE